MMFRFASACGAAPIDRQVAAAFLEAVAPAEIEALAKARKMRRRADEAVCHAQEQQIQRLRYQASLAERQFNRVDPDNRLVAAELERRWEAALLELAGRGSTETPTSRPAREYASIDPRLRAKVVALAARLPAIWADPETPREAVEPHPAVDMRCRPYAAGNRCCSALQKLAPARSDRPVRQAILPWRG